MYAYLNFDLDVQAGETSFGAQGTCWILCITSFRNLAALESGVETWRWRREGRSERGEAAEIRRGEGGRRERALAFKG